MDGCHIAGASRGRMWRQQGTGSPSSRWTSNECGESDSSWVWVDAGIFYLVLSLERHVCAKSLQLCLTLCGPVDCSLPGSCVHGILQARILEWVAISHSKRSSQPSIEPKSFMSPAFASGFFIISTTWGAQRASLSADGEKPVEEKADGGRKKM